MDDHKFMALSPLNTISPVDGRYLGKTRALTPYFSEYGLIYHRLFIEIKWLESLAANDTIQEIPKLDDA